jgi:large subunit ribosomal protein L32
MPVPKRKRSRARRDSRFANKGLQAKSFSSCANCTSPVLPHQACSSCGFYKGKKVLVTKMERASKRLQARKAKAAAETMQQQQAQAAEQQEKE